VIFQSKHGFRSFTIAAAFGVTLAVLAAGCDRKETVVRSYDAPKDAAPTTGPSAGGTVSANAVGQRPDPLAQPAPGPGAPAAAPAGTLPLQWTLPAGWTQDPTPRAMRVATVNVDANGQHGDLIVTRFRTGGFGSLVDNINRWRQQVGLPPVKDEKEVTPEKTTVGGAEAKVYDFTGAAAGATASKRNRVVAIETPAGDTWFFRFSGPAGLVESQKWAFDSLLQSVKFAG